MSANSWGALLTFVTQCLQRYVLTPLSSVRQRSMDYTARKTLPAPPSSGYEVHNSVHVTRRATVPPSREHLTLEAHCHLGHPSPPPTEYTSTLPHGGGNFSSSSPSTNIIMFSIGILLFGVLYFKLVETTAALKTHQDKTDAVLRKHCMEHRAEARKGNKERLAEVKKGNKERLAEAKKGNKERRAETKKGVKATKAVLATILQILQKIEGTVGPIFAASGVLPATYATPPPAFVALTEDSSLPSGTAPCLIGSGISGSSGPSSVVPLSAVQGSLRDNSRSLNSRTGMKAVHGQSKLREVMSMAPNTTSFTATDLHLDDEIGSQLDIEYEEENSQPQHGLVGARTAQFESLVTGST